MVLKTVRRALRRRLCTQEPVALDEDEVFSLLSNERRREVIRFVAYNLDGDETAEIGDAAMYVACVENEKPPEDVTYEERQAVYVGLYQRHIPRLDGAGVLEWDQRAGTIRRGGDVDALAQVAASVERATAAAPSAARYQLAGADGGAEASASAKVVA